MRTLEQQIATLDKIREAVLASPEHLDMSQWHSECNTTHCMAGLAQVQNQEDLPITVGPGAQNVGNYLLPDYAKMFYGSTEHVLIWLRSRAYCLKEGEVDKDEVSGLWVDLGCNLFDGNLSQEDAKKQSASNKQCVFCTNCTGCAICTNCTICTNCKVCTDCTDCTECIDRNGFAA